jgi:hexosaminidase
MRHFCFLLLLLCSIQRPFAQSMVYNLVPTPASVETRPGIFMLQKLYVAGNTPAFSPLQEWLKRHAQSDIQTKAATGFHELRYTTNKNLPEEGYELHITPDKLEIFAATPAGFLYAEQTLIQLAEQNNNLFVPCLLVRDQPRFSWRGMHLDESRHFMGKTFVYKYIDWLFALKMNVFHWHLTDAQGWRIEIKQYPKLTSVAAWRPDRTGILNSDADTAKVGEPMTYGGFYTQQDVRDIVAYAAKRNITIIPEIEMPGHTTAALVAYPEYSCSGGPFPMPGGAKNCPYPNFCVGNEKTYTFLENILTEVMALFPSPYIHIGGDEVERTQWAACPRCQARKSALGLADEAQLQVYFTKRIETFLQGKGRRLMGWDEIMEGGNLTSSAGVMVWRGEGLAREATTAGHEIVIAHNYYFDLYQGNPAFEPVTYGYLPLEQVYQYEPVPADFTEAQRKLVRGVEGCLWTENVYDTRQAEYMLFPRLFALADVAWLAPGNRNWEDFKRRLPGMMQWLDKRETYYATSVFNPAIHMTTDTAKRTLLCRFSQQIPYGVIRFTTNGDEPTADSDVYEAPFSVSKPAEIKATAFLPGDKKSKTLSMAFRPSLASGKPFTLAAAPDKKYNGDNPAAITDGLTGTDAFHDGRWCGFYGTDLDVSIDLGSAQKLTTVQLNWLEAENSWIYLPVETWVETSNDGSTWARARVLSAKDVAAASTARIKPVRLQLDGVTARYVRVVGKNRGAHPVYPDGKCWLFVDEIRVD